MYKTITVQAEDGRAVECDVLFTFDSDETGKSYIVYTDNTRDENGQYKVFASVYDPTGESLTLQRVETDAEWEIIEHVRDTLVEQVRMKMSTEEE